MKKNVALLFLTALIWGTGFVAQSAGAEHVSPFAFNFIRCILGGSTLFIYLKIRDRKRNMKNDVHREMVQRDKKMVYMGGILCGIVLCIGMALQQISIAYTSVAKAGFVTGLYILLVPILGIFLRKRVDMRIWCSTLIALVGLYFLCITENFSIHIEDIYMLICALFFAIHILVIDFFTPKVDGVRMSCIQFFVCAFISGILMLAFETPNIASILNSWFSIVYAGVVVCGVAYTSQIMGQKGTDPTTASLVLSLETVVSVLAGFLILGEGLTLRELIGCILMFGAIVLSQLPQSNRRK